jgi:hypothetical protein
MPKIGSSLLSCGSLFAAIINVTTRPTQARQANGQMEPRTDGRRTTSENRITVKSPDDLAQSVIRIEPWVPDTKHRLESARDLCHGSQVHRQKNKGCPNMVRKKRNEKSKE